MKKSSLSKPQRRLLETMAWIEFGLIKDLMVEEGGVPVLDPPPRLFKDLKLGADGGKPVSQQDFHLKRHVVAFFEHLASIGKGIVAVVEIRHGLPTRITWGTSANKMGPSDFGQVTNNFLEASDFDEEGV